MEKSSFIYRKLSNLKLDLNGKIFVEKLKLFGE
jgi:hypothetical protein